MGTSVSAITRFDRVSTSVAEVGVGFGVDRRSVADWCLTPAVNGAGGDYLQRGSFTVSIDELPASARLTGRMGRAISLRNRRHFRNFMADRALPIRRLGPAKLAEPGPRGWMVPFTGNMPRGSAEKALSWAMRIGNHRLLPSQRAARWRDETLCGADKMNEYVGVKYMKGLTNF